MTRRKVLDQVKSHARGLSVLNFFDPCLHKPNGSNFAGKSAKLTALSIISLALKSLGILPDLPAANVIHSKVMSGLPMAAPIN